MADATYRLCTRVRTNPFLMLELSPDAAITTGPCSRCDVMVWVDAAQPIPDGVPIEIILLCTECALDDSHINQTLEQNLMTAYLKKQILGQTHVWEIDDGK